MELYHSKGKNLRYVAKLKIVSFSFFVLEWVPWWDQGWGKAFLAVNKTVFSQFVDLFLLSPFSFRVLTFPPPN